MQTIFVTLSAVRVTTGDARQTLLHWIGLDKFRSSLVFCNNHAPIWIKIKLNETLKNMRRDTSQYFFKTTKLAMTNGRLMLLFYSWPLSLIPDTQIRAIVNLSPRQLEAKSLLVQPIGSQNETYLESGMRKCIKTVKIQHVSVATWARHVGHVRSGTLMIDGDPVPSERLTPVNVLVILLTVEPQLMLDTRWD